MNCEDARRWIDEDGVPAEVAAHRAECPECDRAFREAERLDAAIRSLPVPEPRAAYWAGYDLRLRARMERRAGSSGRWIAAAAAILIAAGLAAVLMPRETAPPPPVRETAAAGPTPLTRFMLTFAEYARTDDAQARAALEARLDPLGRELWPHLIGKVNSADRRVAGSALDLLVRLRVRESVARLESCLGEEAWRNEAVLSAVARLDLPDSPGVLGRALRHPERQAQALSACSILPPRRAVPVIVAAYAGLAPESRAAADAYLHAQAPLARRALAQQMDAADNATLAALAPLAGDLRLREAAPRLLRLARSEEHSAAAIDGLARLKDPLLLRPLLDQSTSNALAFVQIAGQPARLQLRRLALDADPRIASAAVLMLAEFPGSETLRVLRASVARPATHAVSIDVLGRIDGAEAARILVGIYAASTRKSEIVTAVGRCGVPEMAPWLLRAALEPQVSVDAAREVLSSVPQREVVPALIAGLERYDRRSRAHEILRRLTEQNLPASAAAWERWWKKQG